MEFKKVIQVLLVYLGNKRRKSKITSDTQTLFVYIISVLKMLLFWVLTALFFFATGYYQRLVDVANDISQ